MKHYRIGTALVIAAAVALPGAVFAQSAASFPTKPVRVVIAQSAGGATDILTRLFAAKISEKLGQQFAGIAKSRAIVENLSSDGGEPVGSTPEQLKQSIAAEVPRWRKVVKDSGMRLE